MLRSRIAETWRADGTLADWSDRCFVVVHPDGAALSQATAVDDSVPVGWTTITVDQGEVIFRRIDLRADAPDWQVNALPHELTHVVLAHEFAGRHLPGWFNEGAAMGSETPELQQRRLDLLDEARQSGRLPSLGDVLNRAALHGHQDRDVLYAASYSLVRRLHAERGPRELLEFIRQVEKLGYKEALHQAYGINGGVAELERLWLAGCDGLSASNPRIAHAFSSNAQ